MGLGSQARANATPTPGDRPDPAPAPAPGPSSAASGNAQDDPAPGPARFNYTRHPVYPQRPFPHEFVDIDGPQPGVNRWYSVVSGLRVGVYSDWFVIASLLNFSFRMLIFSSLFRTFCSAFVLGVANSHYKMYKTREAALRRFDATSRAGLVVVAPYIWLTTPSE